MRLVDADELIKDIQESSKLCMFDDLASKEAYRNMVEFAIYSIEDAETVYDNDRLKELADADKEGRCLVLPCKVGDVLYKSTRTFVSSFKVAFIEVSMCNCLFIHTNLISGINMTGEIFKEDDIGKCVFLTKEEAEKALEGLE